MNKRSIATVSLSGALDEKLRAIAAAGFDAVEIFENDLLSFSGSPRDVGTDLPRPRSRDLRVPAVPRFRGHAGAAARAQFARAERKFDLMQELGTDLLLICSNVSPASLGGIDRAADDFRELGERAAARGLRVGYEAFAWGRHVNDYRDAWEIVRRADHPAIGIILDSFHALAPGFPTRAMASIPADKIFLVQLADAPKLELDILSWSRHFRCFPGQGDLPVARVHGSGRGDRLCRAAVAGDLQRPVPRRLGGPQTAIDGLRSLILLRGPACGAIGRSSPASRWRRRRRAAASASSSLPSTRQRPANSPACSPARFSQDRHASQQGGGALVAGQGRARDQLRDRRLCAFALRDARPRRLRHCARRRQCRPAMQRAETLKARTFYQPVGPGELEIPAIHGVGGSLLYFLDEAGKNWDRISSRSQRRGERSARCRRSHLAVDAL